MNFAVPFMRNFQFFDDPVELNIKYKPEVTKLVNFIEQYGGSHRINLLYSTFDTKTDVKIFQGLQEKFPDYKIVAALPYYTQELEQTVNTAAIPHYYLTFVTNWELFQGFLTLNVTDIFLAESIMFDIIKIKKILQQKEKKIALRSYCNVCESAWINTPSIKKFFIRPEDLPLYEDLIDTFEFFLPDSLLSVTRLNTLYTVYTRDKYWFGQFKELITGYESEEDSRFIISSFGEQRLSCRQKCMSSLEPTCHICDRIVQLGKALKDKNIMVQIDNNKNF